MNRIIVPLPWLKCITWRHGILINTYLQQKDSMLLVNLIINKYVDDNFWCTVLRESLCPLARMHETKHGTLNT